MLQTVTLHFFVLMIFYNFHLCENAAKLHLKTILCIYLTECSELNETKQKKVKLIEMMSLFNLILVQIIIGACILIVKDNWGFPFSFFYSYLLPLVTRKGNQSTLKSLLERHPYNFHPLSCIHPIISDSEHQTSSAHSALSPSGFWAPSACLFVFSIVTPLLLHFLHPLWPTDHGKSPKRSIVEPFSHSFFSVKGQMVPVGCSGRWLTHVSLLPVGRHDSLSKLHWCIKHSGCIMIHIASSCYHSKLRNCLQEWKYPSLIVYISATGQDQEIRRTQGVL